MFIVAQERVPTSSVGKRLKWILFRNYGNFNEGQLNKRI